MIIFMGVTGSGKSVQGKLLADKLALPWISTGEFLRMLISGQKRIDMLEGKLIDDQEIIGLIQKIFGLINVREDFVLDGFPRTAPQADWLLSQVKYGQVAVTGIIHLLVDQNVVKERLLIRGRQDDYEQAINERLKEYENSIKPILQQFKKAGLVVHEIDGDQSVTSVHSAVVSCLKK